jgi:hypothetical protein
MHMPSFLVLCMTLMCIGGNVEAQSQSDEELRKLLVGTWVPSIGDKTSLPATNNYRADGALNLSRIPISRALGASYGRLRSGRSKTVA